MSGNRSGRSGRSSRSNRSLGTARKGKTDWWRIHFDDGSTDVRLLDESTSPHWRLLTPITAAAATAHGGTPRTPHGHRRSPRHGYRHGQRGQTPARNARHSAALANQKPAIVAAIATRPATSEEELEELEELEEQGQDDAHGEVASKAVGEPTKQEQKCPMSAAARPPPPPRRPPAAEPTKQEQKCPMSEPLREKCPRGYMRCLEVSRIVTPVTPP